MTITTPLWQKKSTLIILWVWVAGVEQASTTVLSKNCSVMSTAFLIMLVTDQRTGWWCHVQAGTGPLMQQLAQATWKGICILGGQVDGIIFIWWGMVSWAVGRCRMLDRYWIGHGSFNRFSWREKRKKKINVMIKLLFQAIFIISVLNRTRKFQSVQLERKKKKKRLMLWLNCYSKPFLL